MRMTDAQMYSRVLASDASFNGRFFFGVRSTGIYCLPSCCARKPKIENVRFFPTAEAARAAGLRACRKCHPDDFACGTEPVLETIEALAAEIRGNPASFPDSAAIVRRSGFGATRLFELLRQHYHATPGDLLMRARLDAAKRALLHTSHGLSRIAADAGFESLSVFHEQFRSETGMTPASYRSLGSGSSFKLFLPAEYPLQHLRRALGRDTASVTERLEGDTYTCAVRLDSTPALLTMRLARRQVAIAVTPGPSAGTYDAKAECFDRTKVMSSAHAVAAGLLGLGQDTAGFARLARRLGLSRLTAGRAGLRISQTHSVFEGLLWSVIGQQINLPFARRLRRRLIERTGTPVGEGLIAPPTPEAVAALPSDAFTPMQFSRQKTDYLLSICRLIADGKLNLDGLRGMSATRAERTLLGVRGLGPWSVHYILMRSLGFPDCVPLGDTGLTSGLRALFRLDARPDVDATRRLMRPFSPFRSLATAHLWQLAGGPAPRVEDRRLLSRGAQMGDKVNG